MSYNLYQRKMLLAGIALILIVAFLLRLYFALALPSIHHPDEVFQYLEQAHRLVFKYGIIPWEYREGTRSWFVPGLLAGLVKLSDILRLSGPTGYLFLVASILSAFSLSIVVVGSLWAYRTQGAVAAIITAALCCIWFELVYFAPKTLVEPIAANILLIAVYLAYPGQPIANSRRLFVAGLLFGLVVAIRVNLAPAILVAAIYICRSQFSDKWIPIVLGGLVTFTLVGLIDAFSWQYPFQAFASNIWVNVVEKKSEMFGTQPWYYFAGKWLLIWQGALVPMVICSAVALRKNLLLGLLPTAIIATHMLFAHKEYRFVFPAVPFIVILVGLGTSEIFGYFQRNIKTRKLLLITGGGVVFGWTLMSGILATSSQFRPNWYRQAGSIHAFDFLHHRSDLCGVGLLRMNWWDTAGYTHLHQNVPIIIPQNNIVASFPAYNYLVADREKLPENPLPYTEVICWSEDKVCVYRRNGPCKSSPDREVNEVLRRRGQ